MDILKAIKEWFYTYDKLNENGIIYADHLPHEVINYAIHKLPMQQGDVIRRFVGGDRLMQFAFAFDVITPYSTVNNTQNDRNIQFLVELQEWVENHIELPGVENAQRMEVLQSGFLFDVDTNSQTAVYRMTARLVYYQERKLK